VILEVAILDVKQGLAAEFETAFEIASDLIATLPGYISHELHRKNFSETQFFQTTGSL
jgi:heme-degrading monooxygenase HmoA